MNLDQLKKNVGFRVQLEPPAIHLDALGRELPSKNEDWIIQSVTDTDVRLDEATILGLTTTIGKDSVHHFSRNASRTVPGGRQYGFLYLTLQMFIQSDKVTYRPCARPGERVAPLAAPIAQMWVESSYPVASGMLRKLEMAGYRTRWCSTSRLARLQLEGWEVVVEKDRHGMPTSFHLRTNPESQVYVKTREPDLQALANNPFWRMQPGLISCGVNIAARALEFRFSDPTNAVAFQMRMARGQNGMRCQFAPGRVDTVLGHLIAQGGAEG